MKVLRYSILATLLSFGLVSYGQELPPEPTVDSDKNWTSSISYDLLGNTQSKGVSYFNTLGKGTQGQSWDILTNKVWASQVLYDNQGRPALQTLSAPIGTNFGLNDTNFMLNASGFTYGLNDFDTNTTIESPSIVNASSKLGDYYLYNNQDNFQDNTPFPFSRTIYSKLNPGSPKKVIGGNKIDGEWLQSYSFSMPAGQELSKLNAFGNSSYNDDKITKTVVRDVNGIDTVVFTDSDGNTLAAARSGNEDGNNTISHTNDLYIKAQGFVDIHIPQGVNNSVTLRKYASPQVQLKIYNLIDESEVQTLSLPENTSTNTQYITLSSGFYRIAITDFETIEDTEAFIDKITITHRQNYYDYSLNTYDKAGRLLSSTQPLGDDLQSTYKYNSLGQLLETSSPDEGTAKFKYRRDGQIRFSQNSKQALLGEVSFTDYDDLGRPVKSGVATANFDALNPDTSEVSTMLKEIHITSYDEPDPKLIDLLNDCSIDVTQYKQTFLYGNVSTTVTDKPFTNQTWYSYDVYGRVKWLVQSTAALDCVKTIDYSYHPVTGQVTKVDYQRHVPNERFVHQYDYNEAGQLITVSTSRDDIAYTENAKYFYTESGALRRTELAENLQGIDYVYNMAGQLKAINSPLSSGFKDPGNDSPGTNGFLTDVFGMILDYHNQDYARNGSHLNGLKNTGVSLQKNGNIASIRWNNDTPAANTVDSYTYSYNKNNWLTQANFGTATTTSTGLTSFSTNTNQDYKVDSITYDANGNISTLKRNGVTNQSGSNAMDEFTYHYKDGTNQLTAVEDTNDNPDPTRYNDLKNQYINTTVAGPFGDEVIQAQDNYIYNNIGQLETNVQEQISYEYNASGLVTRINSFTDTNTGRWSTIYSEDFALTTDNEAQLWTPSFVNSRVYINYNAYSNQFLHINCTSLQDTYGNSLGIRNDGSGGTAFGASRSFTVLPNKLHQLSLDVIVKQIEDIHFRGNTMDPNNPPPTPQDNPMGYLIEILDDNNQLLGTTSYNYPNPVEINDPNLDDFIPCDAFYTNAHNYQFTPTTDKINLKVTVYQNTAMKGALYLDNIDIEVAETPKMAFYYNDRGHRVRKEFYDNNGFTHRTIYVRDASGSPMAIYTEVAGKSTISSVGSSGGSLTQVQTQSQPLRLKEHPVYGASRLGIYYKEGTEGTYAYQITDHLGNVRAVMIKDGDNALSITNKTDYYPFGMPMPDRNIEGNYRYGYQGEYAEKEPELGNGQNSFELRLWDSRIGRWLSVDPMHEFASPYLGIGNNPINLTDPTGGVTDDPPTKAGTYEGQTHFDPDTGVTYEWDGKNAWHSDLSATTALNEVIVKPFGIAKGTIFETSQDADIPITFAKYKILYPEFAGMNLSQAKTHWNTYYNPDIDTRSRIEGYDYKKAVEGLNSRYKQKSVGRCAKYVRLALEDGGMNTGDRPASTVSAKNYVHYLPTKGFKTVPVLGYKPLAGDIIVFQSYIGGSKHGHIQMFNGTQWISDFKQKSFWPSNGYKKASNYTIFR